ncbi:MAG: type II toxin-antitoxin system death-on-curing family toxin [Pseudomonadota bacterium]|nr:type II toxin-antitoxin system death-on-curing family toxin [Pseudomonadales bacterium]MDY6918598.1 type II toxin-antitoxin system death-on-curing family toxin [Pseudomonadota bacterium]
MIDLDDLTHLTALEIRAIHDSILMGNPGLKGSRPDLSVDSLIGRIHTNLAYQPAASIAEVAALYAEVIARGHVFNDGNKRTALVCMLTFLDLNGYTLKADQNAVADQMVDLAEGKLGRQLFSTWLAPKLLSH